MRILIARAILININLLYLFAHCDIVKINFSIHAAWSQKKMVYLRKCNSSARLTTMSIKNKLFALLAQTMWAFCKYARSIPNYDLPIFVSWCKNMPFNDWKFYHGYLYSISLLILRMMRQDHLTRSLITYLLIIKTPINQISFIA